MTQNQIKEAISRKYIELIVNQIGHKVVPIPQIQNLFLERLLEKFHKVPSKQLFQ